MTCHYQTRVPCTYQRPPNSQHPGYYCVLGSECPFVEVTPDQEETDADHPKS